MDHIQKSQLGFYIYLGQKLLDVLMLVPGSHSNPVKIPLSSTISSDKIVIITKTVGDEFSVGSVSIPQHIIQNGGLNTYNQWITLFEHRDDDEYDGQMGVQDDETPKIQVSFQIQCDTTQKKPEIQKRMASPKQHQSPETLKPKENTKQIVETKSTVAPKFKLESPQSKVLRIGNFSVSDELLKNKTQAQDPEWLVQLLKSKVFALSDQINNLQKNNFVIEDDILDKMQIFNQFNDQTQQHTAAISQSTKFFEQRQAEMSLERREEINMQQEECISLKQKLEQLAVKLQDLTLESDTAANLTNELFVQHLKSAQTQSKFDYAELDKNKEIRSMQTESRQNVIDKIRDHQADIILNSSYYTGKINEYQVLLEQYALEKCQLVDQINLAKADLMQEESQLSLLQTKISYEADMTELLQQDVNDFQIQIAEKKREGEDIYSDIRDRVSIQEDQIIEISETVSKLNSKELQQQAQINSEVESELKSTISKNQILERSATLAEQARDQCDRALEQRVTSRQAATRIKQKLIQIPGNSNIDLNFSNEVDGTQVQELLDVINQQDRLLFHDLTWLKDSVNGLTVNMFVDDLLRNHITKIRSQTDSGTNEVLKQEQELLKSQKLIKKYQDLAHNLQDKANDKNLKILQDSLMQYIKESKNIGDDLNQRKKQIKQLQQQHAFQVQKQVDYEKLAEQQLIDIQQKDEKLQFLMQQQALKNEQIVVIADKITGVAKKDAVRDAYSAIKGDLVDEMLARYINTCGVQLPITRLGGGFYMFGTRRIFAKISNNKLIVRVGGGFTSIDEFITQYGEGELLKIKSMNPEQLAALHTPNGLKNVISAHQARQMIQSKSPRTALGSGSPRRHLTRNGSGAVN